MEIHTNDRALAELGNDVSDAVHKALSKGLGADFICSVLIGVAADYWMECYTRPVTDLVGILTAKAAGITTDPPHFDITDDGFMFTLPAWKRDNEATSLRLMMCSIEVPPETIATWTDDQVKAADCWACSVSLIASDNDDIKAPPKPDFLPEETPWKQSVPGTIM